MTTYTEPLDVWLKFDADDDDDEEPSHEANTYDDGDDGYIVEWYHVAVGLVSSKRFGSLDAAYAWYETNGFQDFTS